MFHCPLHQVDIALLATFLPGFEIDPSLLLKADGAKRFVEKVQKYKDGSVRERAAAIALCSYTQATIIDEHSNHDWREAQTNLREVGDKFDNENSNAIAEAAEFRNAQWAATCDKWNKLITGPLSLNAIKAFGRS